MRYLIALLLVLTAPAYGSEQLDRYLRQIFDSRELQAKQFGPARWIDKGTAYTTLEAKEIVRYDTATGARTVLIPTAAITPAKASEPLKIDDYRWSEDAKQLLIFTNTKKVWRNNTRGDYWVLNRTTGALKKLGSGAPESSLMFAHFSPDGTRVAYVRANNVYVEDIASGKVKALTSDGSATIINGTSDWVYEEELSLRDCASEMSSKALVIDANILVRAVLGQRVRRLLEIYCEDVSFYLPQAALSEAEEHLPALLGRRGNDSVEALKVLRAMADLAEIVLPATYSSFKLEARERLGSRDPDDWPILAAALSLECPIWTEDTDFFGCGVATWTSGRVQRYLRQ